MGELQYVRTSTQLVNRALPLGGGRGLSQLTLEHSDRTSPYPIKSRPRLDGSGLEYYIEDETSILAYGPHEEAPQDDTINPISNSDTDLTLAANALYDKTVQWLLRRKDPQVAYRVRCKTLPDSVRPGSLIWLRYKGLVMDGTQPVHFATVDAKFWVLAVTVTYTADARREYTLTVASVDAELADDTDLIVGRLKRLEVARAVPQPVPTKYTDTKEREIAPSHSVIIPIQISNAVLYLHRCILTLQTRPLRATALAAASGGGQVISSNEDGAHRHLVGVVSPDFPGPVNGASINFYRYEVYGILGNNDEGTVFVGDGGGAMWNPYPTYWYTSAADSGHQHSITLPNHTHGITYGIFDDTDHPRMISLSVNGSDMTSSLKDLNSNTYGPWQAANAPVELRFDLTEKLIADGVRRNHQIGVSCAAGQGTIESIVDALMTAQSVAVRPS